MKTEITEIVELSNEVEMQQDQEATLRVLQDAELLMVGGGGGDVVFG